MPRSAGLARLAGLLILVALLVLPTSHAIAAPKPEPGEKGPKQEQPVWTGVPGTNIALNRPVTASSTCQVVPLPPCRCGN